MVSISEGFAALAAAGRTFYDLVKVDDFPSATQQHPDHAHASRDEAASLYTDYFFPKTGLDEGEDEETHPNTVSKALGVVGASVRTLEAAIKFNNEKDRFAETLATMRRKQIEIKRSIKGKERVVQLELGRVILRLCRLGELSQRQACRRVLIVTPHPDAIGFTPARVRTITRLTTVEARDLLRRRDETLSVRKQLGQLAAIPWDEPLAVVSDLTPHFRANVSWYQGEGGARYVRGQRARHKQYRTSMPLLIPMEAGDKLPVIRWPANNDLDSASTSSRRRRAHEKLEDSSFLPAIHVYRYRPERRDDIRRTKKWQERLGRFRDRD